MAVSAVAMIAGTAYVFRIRNPNSLSWESSLEDAAIIAVWLAYILVSVGGSLVLIRKAKDSSKIISVYLAALPAAVVTLAFTINFIQKLIR